MKFVVSDGGRAASGFKGDTGDCGVRAISIATGLPYGDVYKAINSMAKLERTGRRKRGISSARTGVYRTTMHRYMDSIGWRWKPTMHIGSGCTVHVRDGELPMGRLILNLSRHYCAVINGVIHDTSDPSRDGTRCVYGYWHPAL